MKSKIEQIIQDIQFIGNELPEFKQQLAIDTLVNDLNDYIPLIDKQDNNSLLNGANLLKKQVYKQLLPAMIYNLGGTVEEPSVWGWISNAMTNDNPLISELNKILHDEKTMADPAVIKKVISDYKKYGELTKELADTREKYTVLVEIVGRTINSSPALSGFEADEQVNLLRKQQQELSANKESLVQTGQKQMMQKAASKTAGLVSQIKEFGATCDQLSLLNTELTENSVNLQVAINQLESVMSTSSEAFSSEQSESQSEQPAKQSKQQRGGKRIKKPREGEITPAGSHEEEDVKEQTRFEEQKKEIAKITEELLEPTEQYTTLLAEIERIIEAAPAQESFPIETNSAVKNYRDTHRKLVTEKEGIKTNLQKITTERIKTLPHLMSELNTINDAIKQLGGIKEKLIQNVTSLETAISNAHQIEEQQRIAEQKRIAAVNNAAIKINSKIEEIRNIKESITDNPVYQTINLNMINNAIQKAEQAIVDNNSLYSYGIQETTDSVILRINNVLEGEPATKTKNGTKGILEQIREINKKFIADVKKLAEKLSELKNLNPVTYQQCGPRVVRLHDICSSAAEVDIRLTEENLEDVMALTKTIIKEIAKEVFSLKVHDLDIRINTLASKKANSFQNVQRFNIDTLPGKLKNLQENCANYNLEEEELLEELDTDIKNAEQLVARLESKEVKIVEKILAAIASAKLERNQETDTTINDQDPIINLLNTMSDRLTAKRDHYLDFTVDKQSFVTDFINTMTETIREADLHQITDIESNVFVNMINAINLWWNEFFYSEDNPKPLYRIQFFSSPTEKRIANVATEAYEDFKNLAAELHHQIPQQDNEEKEEDVIQLSQ